MYEWVGAGKRKLSIRKAIRIEQGIYSSAVYQFNPYIERFGLDWRGGLPEGYVTPSIKSNILNLKRI